MTNRGLSIKLKITPWSADTYLAYLDCAQKEIPTQQVGVGIFLRRLREDDQYVRVNLSGKGIWVDADKKYLQIGLRSAVESRWAERIRAAACRVMSHLPS